MFDLLKSFVDFKLHEKGSFTFNSNILSVFFLSFFLRTFLLIIILFLKYFFTDWK